MSDGLLSPTDELKVINKQASADEDEETKVNKSLLNDFEVIIDPKKTKNFTVSLDDSDEDSERTPEDKLLQAFLIRFESELTAEIAKISEKYDT